MRNRPSSTLLSAMLLHLAHAPTEPQGDGADVAFDRRPDPSTPARFELARGTPTPARYRVIPESLRRSRRRDGR